MATERNKTQIKLMSKHHRIWTNLITNTLQKARLYVTLLSRYCHPIMITYNLTSQLVCILNPVIISNYENTTYFTTLLCYTCLFYMLSIDLLYYIESYHCDYLCHVITAVPLLYIFIGMLRELCR